jgi:hypothetical protein
MHRVAKPFNLSWDMTDLRWFFNNFNFEKLLLAHATLKICQEILSVMLLISLPAF